MHLADHHQFLCAHMFDRMTASTPISPDIDEQIEARLAPFMWKTILHTRSSSPKTWGAAPTPLVLAEVEC